MEYPIIKKITEFTECIECFFWDNSVKHRVISFSKSGKIISLLQQYDDNRLMREFHYLLHEV